MCSEILTLSTDDYLQVYLSNAFTTSSNNVGAQTFTAELLTS